MGNSCQTTTSLPARQKRARSSPTVNTPSKRPALKTTPPLAARTKAAKQAILPSSPPPSTSTSTSTNNDNVPTPGSYFADALKFPTAPMRNSERNTNFRQSKFDKFRHNISDKTQ